jgi:O-acetylserine/cysteine efflux transporter
MSVKNTFLVLLYVFLCAGSLIAQKFALQHTSVLTMNCIRFSLLAPALLLFWRRKSSTPLSHYFWVGLFWNVFHCAAIGAALSFGVNVTVTAVLIQTNIFFTILIALWWFRERIRFQGLMGMGLACWGVIQLSGLQWSNVALNQGLLFLLLGSLVWSVGFNLAKHLKIGRSLEDMVWLAVTSLPVLWTITLWIEGTEPIIHMVTQGPWTAWTSIAFSSLFSTLLAAMIWLYLSHQYSTATLMPFTLLMPLASGLIAWNMFDEIPTQGQVLSVLFILGGVALSQGWIRWRKPWRKVPLSIAPLPEVSSGDRAA